MKSKLKTLGIQLLIFLILGEIGSRLILPSHHQMEHLHFNTTEIDEELGWKTKANYSSKKTVEDGAGVPYSVDYQSFENGFRNVNSFITDTIEKKIWFIGDSYTQAVEVSNDKTFYSLIEEKMPFLNVFAYGSSGYSTLQEYLIFEKYVEEIKPDLVVWQYCSNDFIDNYHELELESAYKIGVRRPYLTLDETIKFYTPIPKMLEWSKYSKLVFAIYLIKEEVKSKFSNSISAEQKIAEKHLDYSTYKKANDITGLILKKIKSKLPENTKLLFFPADGFNPQLDDFIQLCRENKIEIDFQTIVKLNEAEFDRNEMIYTYDKCHWNEHGHEIVAEVLESKIRAILKE